MNLPPPTNFSEGQRALFGIAAGVAGVIFGLAVLGGSLVVLIGHWAPGLEPVQLYIIAGCIAAGCLNTTIVIVGLLLGGPVGRVKVEGEVGGNKVGIDAAGQGEP